MAVKVLIKRKVTEDKAREMIPLLNKCECRPIVSRATFPAKP
jgi:hypothetical protein